MDKESFLINITNILSLTCLIQRLNPIWSIFVHLGLLFMFWSPRCKLRNCTTSGLTVLGSVYFCVTLLIIPTVSLLFLTHDLAMFLLNSIVFMTMILLLANVTLTSIHNGRSKQNYNLHQLQMKTLICQFHQLPIIQVHQFFRQQFQFFLPSQLLGKHR